MSERYLSLALGGLSLKISGTRIIGNRYPRITAESGENARSSYGTFIGYGCQPESAHFAGGCNAAANGEIAPIAGDGSKSLS
jgi:hypothetical protein